MVDGRDGLPPQIGVEQDVSVRPLKAYTASTARQADIALALSSASCDPLKQAQKGHFASRRAFSVNGGVSF
jgi:hypothetical protein